MLKMTLLKLKFILINLMNIVGMNELSAKNDRLKRSAFICELSAEMEQCIPAPDDVESRVDDMALREAINGFLGTLGQEKRNIFIRRYWYLDSIAHIS